MGEVCVMANTKLHILGKVFRMTSPVQEGSGTFYRHLRPIAVASLLLGSLPLAGVCGRDGRKIQHRWLGVRVVWDVLLFSVAVGNYVYVTLALPGSRDDDSERRRTLMNDFLTWLFVFHGCAQFLLCHKTAPELPPLLAELEDAYQQHGVRGRLERTLREYGIFMFAAMLLIAAYSSLVGFVHFLHLDITLPHQLLLTPTYLVLTTPVTVPLVLYSFLALSMDALFHDARKSLVVVLTPVTGAIVDDLRFSTERLWYTTLCNLASKLEACFGSHLLLNVLLIQVEMVIEMYLFFLMNKSTDMILLSYILYDIALVLLVTNLTTKLTVQASMVLDDLRSIPTSKLTARGQFEVQMFISQIIARPVQISAAGFFIVEKSLLTSILSSVATYLIVMIQFSPFFKDLKY